MYYIQSYRYQVLLIVRLCSGIVNLTYMQLSPALAVYKAKESYLGCHFPTETYALTLLFIGLGIYNFDYIPVLEINQVDVWRGLRMFHDCTDIATFFKGKYILGCLLSYTANIFEVIFTVFNCVRISTVISLYSLHFIAAPSTV